MTGEERLAILETKLAEQGRNSEALSAQLDDIDHKLDAQAVAFSDKLDSHAASFDERLDRLAASFDERLDRLAASFDEKLDKHAAWFDKKLDKFEETLDKHATSSDLRVTALTQKVDSNFKWLVGINVTMWATTVAGLIAIAGILLSR